jgi:glycosyltransferase involved in cell wall biosynthesis
VLFDASLSGNPAGTGTYVRGLLTALKTRADLDLVTSSFEAGSAALLDTRRKTPGSRLRSGLQHLQYYLRGLPHRARLERCDIIFCPTSLTPLSGAVPYVMTVYDLTPLRFRNTQDWLSRQYLVRMLSWGVRRAAAVCAISQAVAAETGRAFPGVRQPVHVTYPGPNPELLRARPTPLPIADRPFALMVGTVEPRKNHVTVLRALRRHLEGRPDSPLTLVAAGSAGWRYQPVLRAIDELGLTDRVVQLGAVAPASLRWLYQEARALLFPSLYEGFGLPVLEALCLGCPVVAARIPSVQEITGDAATLLEPTDVPAWASALDGLANGRPAGDLAGRERAGHFTWDGCAEAAVGAIRAALDRPD